MSTAKPAPDISPASFYPAALAVIPPATGWLADRIGIHCSFILPAFCYLYVLYYAVRESKPAGSV